METLRFDGRVAIVTGAGQGLGKEYAIELAKRGAKVLVNDFSVSMDGKEPLPLRLADIVVADIKRFGGVAVANYDDVVNGDMIVHNAIKIWGRVDIVINNAGILRDTSFVKMTDEDFKAVIQTHLKGSFMVTRAAWNYMREQKYGRVINTTSIAGLYGNFGQANYSAAKLGIHGLTTSLRREGEAKGIFVNTVAPMGETRMIKGVVDPEISVSLNIKHVAPLVLYLCHESCTENGGLFENGAGWIAKLRLQRTKGAFFELPFTPEQLRDRFDEINDFDDSPEYPESGNDSVFKMYENFERSQKNKVGANTTSSGGLKSTALFELIHNYLLKEGANSVKTCQAVYNFQITEKKKGPVTTTWGIDLKNGNGMVSSIPFGKPDATFKMTDEDFWKVCMRQLNPQVAFLQVLLL